MIIGYNFYVRPSGSSGPWVKVNSTPDPQPTFTFDDLEPGVAYDLSATAVDGGGNESPRSTVLSASTVQVELPEPGGEMLLADRNAIDDIVMAAKAVAGQPGIAIATTGPRGYYTKTYGTTTGTTPVTTNDFFRIGSVTKVFVANAILQQVDAGNMTLDDTVNQHVPDLGIPNGDIMTVRQLMKMRAGLYSNAGDLLAGLFYMLVPSWNRTRADNIADMRKAPAFAPGAQYQYNNYNYMLLGYILEAVTGRTIHDIITDDVITPLGLIGTLWLTGNTIPAPSAAAGTGANIDPEWNEISGGMISTIGDMVKFGEHLRDGALISEASHELWESEFCGLDWPTTGPDQFGYGLGLMSFGRWFGYNGALPGFGSAVFYDPESGTVVAILQNLGISLTNLGGGAEALHPLFYEIGKYLYPGSMESPGYLSCDPGILNMSAMLTVPLFAIPMFIGGWFIATAMTTAPLFDVPGLSDKLVLPSIVTVPVFDAPLIAMTVPSMTTEPIFVIGMTHPYLSPPDMPTVPVMDPPVAWLIHLIERNVERDNEPLPLGATGVSVGPLTGAGGGGGCGYRNNNNLASGGCGGGGGATSDAVVISVEKLGETYSVTRGSGGVGGDIIDESGTNGGDAVFSSGDVTIIAGGGKGGAPGRFTNPASGSGSGGTGTATGVSVTFRVGTAGGDGTAGGVALPAPDNNVGGGPGGGPGGGLGYFAGDTPGPGGKGGNSLTATGGAGGTNGVNNSPGLPGGTGAEGRPGGGGGGGGGGNVQRGGGDGGPGAGGGGGGAFNNVSGNGGPGGNGGDAETTLTWYLAIEMLVAVPIVTAPVFAVPVIISPLSIPSITTTPVMEVAGIYTTLLVPSITTTPVMEVAGVYTPMPVPSITTTPVMEVAGVYTPMPVPSITTTPVMEVAGIYTVSALSIIGAAANLGETVTIPAHQVGDLIVISAFQGLSSSAPVKPAAGGTVPNWIAIDNAAGVQTSSHYFVATATNHTSGAWGVSDMAVIVLRGQHSTPIGGHAQQGISNAGSMFAPAVTLTNSDGSSVLIHFCGGAFMNSWGAVPTGYTEQAKVSSSRAIAIFTKDSTTSDGSVSPAASMQFGAGAIGATVEIRAH